MTNELFQGIQELGSLLPVRFWTLSPYDIFTVFPSVSYSTIEIQEPIWSIRNSISFLKIERVTCHTVVMYFVSPLGEQLTYGLS